MKNKYKLLWLLGLLPFFATAQLTNSGATIVIEPGATLVVEGDIDNASGTITNSGTIEVAGDFVNDGSLASSGGDGIVIFNGNEDQNFTSASNVSIKELIVDNSEDKVSFLGAGSVTIGDQLEFKTMAGNLNIGSADLILPAGSTPIINGAATSYIEADGTGKVVKPFAAAESYTLPIGDANEFSPLSITMTSGTSTIGVNVVYDDAGHPLLPSDANNPSRNTTDFLKRSWDIETTGTFGADVVGTYVPGSGADEVGNPTLIKTALYDGASWTYDTNANAANTISASIDADNVVTGSNTFGKSMVQVILGGAYDDVSNLMRTDLNDDGILAAEATDSPYETTLSLALETESVAAGFFAANPTIVDWVKLELRDNSDDETVISSRSAFVLSDGSLMDLTGTDNDVLYFKNATASTYVAIKHRNHLGIMLANTESLLASEGDINFTALAANTYGTNAQQSFDGKFMMWPGDANGDNEIFANASPSDASTPVNLILSDAGNTGVFGSGPTTSYLGVTGVYVLEDLNLDGNVFANASPSDSSLPANSILNHPGNTGVFGSGPTTSFLLLTAQLPEL